MLRQSTNQESFAVLQLSDRLVGESAPMLDLMGAAQSIPELACAVLIWGEPGSGKESIARYAHRNSIHAGGPFIPVDCSSLNAQQFERELFGYVKDAFAGATRDSLGFVRAANGGSVFLDEIGALSLPLQAKLLNMLRERTVFTVGDPNPQPVDVRVFAATARELDCMVRQGGFLPELLAQLQAVTLKTPALRDRSRDILPLAEHFLSIQAQLYREPLKTLSTAAATVIQSYSWPGNVRELANVMEQAHVLACDNIVELSDVPLRLQNPGPPSAEQVQNLSLEDLEKQTIIAALKRSNYNRAEASRLLGINIQRLKRRITRLGLQRAGRG